jgi:hypothetical protein
MISRPFNPSLEEKTCKKGTGREKALDFLWFPAGVEVARLPPLQGGPFAAMHSLRTGAFTARGPHHARWAIECAAAAGAPPPHPCAVRRGGRARCPGPACGCPLLLRFPHPPRTHSSSGNARAPAPALRVRAVPEAKRPAPAKVSARTNAAPCRCGPAVLGTGPFSDSFSSLQVHGWPCWGTGCSLRGH